MASLTETLDLLDLAVTRARGVVDDDAVERAATIAAAARDRGGFLGDVVVVAIAGGTGSGKSSLLNAIAGEEIASVGVLRPHTDRLLAWVPSVGEVELAPFLDGLGVEDRIDNERLPGLVLVDLPDMDSVADWHRRTVEQLLPRLDAVVWVFDPEKYHDPVLHRDFLAPLVPYHRQLVFVVNKADRLDDVERIRVSEHLRELLATAGYPDPEVVTTAAVPGQPIGIDELVAHIGRRLDVKVAALAKVAADVRTAARTLAADEGLWDGSSPGNDDPSWDRAYLGATLASVGVAATALLEGLDLAR